MDHVDGEPRRPSFTIAIVCCVASCVVGAAWGVAMSGLLR